MAVQMYGEQDDLDRQLLLNELSRPSRVKVPGMTEPASGTALRTADLRDRDFNGRDDRDEQATAAPTGPDSSSWNTDGYATPGYTATNFGNVLPGYDAGKWADLN